MKLFLLRWNPHISSWTDADFRKALEICRNGGNCALNWSVREWDRVEPGDWALLCRVGCGDDDGIVMAGRFTGRGFEEDSWRGDGTKCHYADADMVFMNDPAATGLLRASELERTIPGVDWHGGHSGVSLAPEESEKAAAFLANALARLDNHRKAGFATAGNRGETATWLAACSLLSDLCPKLKEEVFTRRKKRSALDFPRLVEEGCELYFDSRAVETDVPLSDLLRPVSWEGVLRVSDAEASGIDFVPLDRRRRIIGPPRDRTPGDRVLDLSGGRRICLVAGDVFTVGKGEIEGLALFLPCGLTALRPEAKAFLREHGAPVLHKGAFEMFVADPTDDRVLRRIVCYNNPAHRLYSQSHAKSVLEEAFSFLEEAGCRIVAMNGFRMDADSEQRTLDLVRDWFAEYPDTTITTAYLVDKRTGFKSAR
ncbi:MAG: hypothetical protein IJV65_04955 [Kiritimatiellae bacterium]|nr:hypothetical protein [Kiritimatiellia bacterium]